MHQNPFCNWQSFQIGNIELFETGRYFFCKDQRGFDVFLPGIIRLFHYIITLKCPGFTPNVGKEYIQSVIFMRLIPASCSDMCIFPRGRHGLKTAFFRLPYICWIHCGEGYLLIEQSKSSCNYCHHPCCVDDKSCYKALTLATINVDKCW